MKNIFFGLAGILLALVGALKIVSGMGSSPILMTFDPVFGIKFSVLFVLVGLIEVGISALCLFSSIDRRRAIGVLWISCSFLFYRAGVFVIGYKRPCPCLGMLTDAIGLRPETADMIAKGILIFLLAGSILVLVQSTMRSAQPVFDQK